MTDDNPQPPVPLGLRILNAVGAVLSWQYRVRERWLRWRWERATRKKWTERN